MTRNRIEVERKDGLGAALESTNSNTMISQQGIAMAFKKFARRIGAALALSVAFWLVIGGMSVSFAQPPFVPGSPSVTMNPTQGATNPGGQTQFQFNFQGATGPGWQPTWYCSFIFMPPRPNGIDIRFAPATVVVPPGQQRTAQATVTVANFVAQAIYRLGVRVNCTASSLTGTPLLYQQDFVYTLQVGSGGGPNPPPPGGTGPCQFNFSFDPPVGNLVQVPNNGNPMDWGWTAGFSIVASAQGNCPATSRFTARLNPQQGGALMMQPPVSGPIPGRYPTTISARNNTAVQVTAIIEICATESVNQPWRCQNYNYQLRRGGGTPGPGPGSLIVQLSVDRGCGATYRIGDRIIISFQASQDAVATLTLTRPDGSQQVVFANQPVRGGVANTIQGMVGEPAGTRTLILEAVSGQARGRAECAFSAGGSSAAQPPATQLQASITTDRGCQETEQNPIYKVGDAITVQFSFTGALQALVTLEDVLPDGNVNVLFQQVLSGNQTFQLTGRIEPPLGKETLRLSVQVGEQVVVAACSFTVEG